MGCCETRNTSDHTIDLQYRNNYNNPVSNGYSSSNKRENMKIVTRPDNESNRIVKKNTNISEIPITKEVRVPSIDIPLEIIKSKKRLSLTIFESKFLSEGTVLNITPGGLDGSERMAKDGLDEIINDFNFPDEDVIGKRHFEIKYDLLKDCYKIKNLFGSGLFVKINKKLLLRNNSIFSFSTSHIIVKISMDSKLTEEGTVATEVEVINSSISLKVIHGINENKEYLFTSKINNKIKLGRIPVHGIDISFGDESTSRVQCIIFYENNNWYIVDGDGVKQSLNGTWYLADEYMDIYEAMIFRAGTTSFQAHLFDP